MTMVSKKNPDKLPPCAAVVVAGGAGTRMGRPKQYLNILGRPMVEWSVEAFRAVGKCVEIVLVLSPEDIALHGKEWEKRGVRIAQAGATRLESVRNGLSALSGSPEVVAVHDGARPLVSGDIILACLREAARHGAAVPAVAVKDTLKIVSKQNKVEKTADRSAFWAAQTPQCYRRKLLEKALKKFRAEKDATDESQLVERAGTEVRVVPSSYDNIKVTTPEDLLMAEVLMKRKIGKRVCSEMIRVGFGYDIHRMVEGRPLILGGVRVPHNKGLLGHSDGDAVLHAVSDAALGSIGAGEIGVFFPPIDLTIRGIPSTAIAD
ncbi:MAG: 2-C-methyl-D-erythritol 4-phosphate cytidylyltransferase, partial [bacterium]